MTLEPAGLPGDFTAGVVTAARVLSSGVEAAAALILGLAILQAVGHSLALMLRGAGAPDPALEAVRLRLGRWLSVVLEFLLAADILETAVAPSWDDIGKLAAIAGIRTALNYFLLLEVREAARGHVEARHAPQDAPERRGGP